MNSFITLLYLISFKFWHKVPRRWCKSRQTRMCQMCNCWCHKWRGQKILSLSTLRKHTITLDMPYICVLYHILFGTKSTVLISVTIFSQHSLIWESQSALHILLLKQIVAIFWVPPLDFLDKTSPYQQTLRTVWWRQRALTWAWILLRGPSSEFHGTRMQNITVFLTSSRTVPSEVFKKE